MDQTKVVNIRDLNETWLTDPQYVYIGRAGKGHDGYFGNPYVLQPGAGRGSTIRDFEAYLKKRMAEDPEFKARVLELKGKTLVCFCAPFPCHGDVLAKVAEEGK